MHQRTTIGDRSLHPMWVLGMELWDHACREHLSPSEPSHRLRQKAFKVLFKIQLFSRTVLTFYGYSSLQTLRSCEPYFFLSKQTETFTQTWGWQLRLVFVLFLSFPLQSLPWERTHLPVPHKVCREIAPSPGPWTTRAEERLLEVKPCPGPAGDDVGPHCAGAISISQAQWPAGELWLWSPYLLSIASCMCRW